jgi:hypothetical protein
MATQFVDTQLRKTGIGVVSDVPWGTRFFMFCETKENLLDTLVPYFKAGLESCGLCLWVASQPLTEEEERGALQEAVTDFDRYLACNSIEVLRGRHFYLSSNVEGLAPNLDEFQVAIREIVNDGARASDVISRIRGLLMK